MGKRTEYAPGTFSWVELSTTDPDGAKAFYSELFDWDAIDMPVGDTGETYTMLNINGDVVAALARQREQQRAQGVPPNWLSYITVADADETAARAAELGGVVHAPPFDVLDVGRMAVLQDPTGAVFAIWQPRLHIGAARVNDPGCLSWNELSTRDIDAVERFYGGLFGWSAEAMEGGPGPYKVVKVGDRANGGIRAMSDAEGNIPPHWLPYFTTESVEQSTAKLAALGGTLMAGPYELAMGRIAIARDPQGAAFALYEGQVEP
jgi:predicted enzyme related to lactoylglutathione lyase